MRDFYDIYLIYTKYWKNINIEHLRKAIDETFAKREYNGNIFESLDIIRNRDGINIKELFHIQKV